MTFKHLKPVILLGFIILLPNCGRVVDWGMSNFYQGEERKYDRSVVNQYMRSKHVYSQLTTVGMFDVLWLAPEVRTLYAQMVSNVYGKNEEKHNAFLRRQLEEARRFVSFYIISSYGLSLGDSQSQWVITLRINDTYYTPIDFKAVELPLEYKSMFGDRLNRFKLPYLIRFDARDIEDKSLLDNANKIELVFRSVDKEAVLVWKFNDPNVADAGDMLQSGIML
jgi:hypothetical protein